ncbi:MAG: hypothetical protein QOK25_820 [Thermoleophilaceae bacterium]|jgi:hypothetical protein|nr:hypothetical protein [Thermoleophilaceae bacterium]
MRRHLTVVTVMAVGSLMASGGTALANSPGYYGDVSGGNYGNSGNAPGQARAADNCVSVFDRQGANGVSPGGGPKSTTPPFTQPTNCDHFFQSDSFPGGPVIGPNK